MENLTLYYKCMYLIYRITEITNVSHDVASGRAHNDTILTFSRPKCDYKVILLSYDEKIIFDKPCV